MSLLKVLIVAIAFCFLTDAAKLRIGSFNVQVFGTSKINKADVMKILPQIFKRYDLVCMMEIRDDTGTAAPTLLGLMNKNEPASNQYDVVYTSRRGRTSSKEQEGYFYKKALFQKLGYWESTSTDFERAPGAVLFGVNNTNITFMHMCEHIQPSSAFDEINSLKVEYEKAKKALKAPRGFMSGDFNAGCGYLSKTKTAQLDLRIDTTYTWLINDTTDTTVASSPCPYDRFVVDSAMLPYVVPKSATVYNYDKEYKLTNQQAAQISDHFAIEFLLNVPDTIPVVCSLQNSCNGRGATVNLVNNSVCVCTCRNKWNGTSCDICPSPFGGVDCDKCGAVATPTTGTSAPLQPYPVCAPVPNTVTCNSTCTAKNCKASALVSGSCTCSQCPAATTGACTVAGSKCVYPVGACMTYNGKPSCTVMSGGAAVWTDCVACK